MERRGAKDGTGGERRCEVSEASPCPFCGSSDVKPKPDEIQFTSSWWVVCLACRGRGPEACHADEAIRAWNERATEGGAR